VLYRYTVRASDPLYGYWFFEAYYQAFAKQLSAISRKFVPETEADVDELLSFKADMYVPCRYTLSN
jgi:hypothetical protein